MATLFFFIAASTGIIITVATLKRALDRGTLNHHRHALILAEGLGLTWMVSFFVPLFSPGVSVQLKPSLIAFGVLHSSVIGILTYGIVRVWLTIKSRKEHE